MSRRRVLYVEMSGTERPLAPITAGAGRGRRRCPRHSLGALVLGVLSGALLAGCQPPRTELPADPSPPPRPFRAVLYPSIPDAGGDSFAMLRHILERGFEARHPDVDLDLKIDPKIDLYDWTVLEGLFGDSASADMVELDTQLLGDVVEAGLVRPFDARAEDTLPLARRAVTVDGIVYGLPTYLCTQVVFARDAGIESVTSSADAVRFLAGLDRHATPLVGNFAGSWTLPGLYVGAWSGTHLEGEAPCCDFSPPAEAYSLPLDPAVVAGLEPLIRACEKNGQNPCLAGAYKEGAKAEAAFATGQANGFAGYTERLFEILGAASFNDLPRLAALPLGRSTRPLVFVDALVVRRSCEGACLADARAFARFMHSLDVRNLIAFSADTEGALPRYLLQANTSFYTSEPAVHDPIYAAVWKRILPVARHFPNRGFRKARRQLEAALLQALAPQPVTSRTPAYSWPVQHAALGWRVPPGKTPWLARESRP